MGLVGGLSKIGDRICVVEGALVLMVLRHQRGFSEIAEERRLEQGDEYADADFFRQVGTAYVHSIMDGEVMFAAERHEADKKRIYLL